MQAAGWCPSDVSKLDNLDLSGLWFARNMDNPRPGDHARCDKYKCTLLYAVSEADYITMHTQLGCSCSHIAVDQGRLASSLERGVIPLISITRQPAESSDDSCVLVEIEEATDESNYVAFSHVWADGLGNPRQNSLPRCQVRRLGALAAQFYGNGDGDNDGTQPVLLWIDTLACPVTPREARNRAIRLMGQTYKRADKILVLDSSLTTKNSQGMSNMEQAIRIYLSNWTRRLWTLQEGVLARKLYIQFGDRALDFDESQAQRLNDWSEACVRRDEDFVLAREARSNWGLVFECAQIRGTEPLRQLHIAGPYISIVFFSKSLHGRSCTKIFDEPVCLGTLVDLDFAPILQAPPEQRMKNFWSTVPRINRSIIFWEGPCLEDDSFRWAPSTLINERHQLPLPDPGDDEVIAARRPEGLEVRFPGILLGRASHCHLPSQFCLRDRRTNTYPFHVLGLFLNPVPPDHLSLALILAHGVELGAHVQSDTVLLVSINEERDGVRYATLLSQGRLSSYSGISSRAARRMAMRQRENLKYDIEDNAAEMAVMAIAQRFATEPDDIDQAFRIAFSQALENSDASQFLRGGYHQGFELDMLPPDTLWCVQRDVGWQVPITDRESQEEFVQRAADALAVRRGRGREPARPSQGDR